MKRWRVIQRAWAWARHRLCMSRENKKDLPCPCGCGLRNPTLEQVIQHCGSFENIFLYMYWSDDPVFYGVSRRGYMDELAEQEACGGEADDDADWRNDGEARARLLGVGDRIDRRL